MPASWSPDGYAALFVHEMPEVIFSDRFQVTLRERVTIISMDEKFIEVCEAGTIRVNGCVVDQPIAIGAVVVGDSVRLVLPSRWWPSYYAKHPVVCDVVVMGTRKGFAGHRFADRTREQFLANEAFLRSAYPGAGQ